MNVRLPVFALLLCLGMSLGVTLSAQAQQRELSLEAAYPLPIGDTYLSKFERQAGASIMYGQPLTGRLSLRVGVQYNRLWDRSGTGVNVYTPRVGLAYVIAISNRMTLVPEAGLSYSRFGFQYHPMTIAPSAINALNGGGFWIGLTPRCKLGERWALGITTEYRATFSMRPINKELDTPYHRQYHALVFGIVGTYRF